MHSEYHEKYSASVTYLHVHGLYIMGEKKKRTKDKQLGSANKSTPN
jgi:hypothetical protein